MPPESSRDDHAATVVLATHNAHKVHELRSILGSGLDGIRLIGYDGPEPVEDGDTFAENALIKARAASVHTGFPALADDSGICVDALGGDPGIHSARYAGSRDDTDNVALLLANLGDSAKREATFRCVAALVVPQPAGETLEFTETGIWAGTILHDASGSGGFGYDPIFRPASADVSAAELTAQEKNDSSHRAIAFRAIIPIVRAHVRSTRH